MNPCIIGLSGVSGAGKSTLAKALSQKLSATLISWADFDVLSTDPEDFIVWYSQGQDYTAFHRESLAKVLAELKSGKEAIHPILGASLKPTSSIIFDAPLGRLHQQTGVFIDTMIHLNVPLDISLCRRLLRDFKESEKTKGALLEELCFYLNHSRPLFFDETLKQGADLVIDGMASPEQQLSLIKNYCVANRYLA